MGPDKLAEVERLSQSAQDAIDERDYATALRELEQALAFVRGKSDDGDCHLWARIQCKLGTVYIEQGNWSAAETCLLDCLQGSRESRDTRLSAEALVKLGQNAFKQGHFETAGQHLEEAMALAAGNRHPGELAFAHLWRGAIAALTGHFKFAEKELLEAARVAGKAGESSTEGRALNILGENSRLNGYHDQALDYYNQALAVYESINNRFGMTMVIHNLGHLMTMMDEKESALEYYDRSLAMAMEIDARPAALEILAALALIAVDAGNNESALELLGVVYADSAAPKEALHMFAEPALAGLRESLSEKQIDTGLARGRSLTLEGVARDLLQKSG